MAIIDFFESVTSILPSRVEFVGGYVEGFDNQDIGCFVTTGLSIVVEEDDSSSEKVPSPADAKRKLVAKDGAEYMLGDILPATFEDISNQFVSTESTDQEQRLADVELMLIELLTSL